MSGLQRRTPRRALGQGLYSWCLIDLGLTPNMQSRVEIDLTRALCVSPVINKSSSEDKAGDKF
jgi:hypothetical protein